MGGLRGSKRLVVAWGGRGLTTGPTLSENGVLASLRDATVSLLAARWSFPPAPLKRPTWLLSANSAWLGRHLLGHRSLATTERSLALNGWEFSQSPFGRLGPVEWAPIISFWFPISYRTVTRPAAWRPSFRCLVLLQEDMERSTSAAEGQRAIFSLSDRARMVYAVHPGNPAASLPGGWLVGALCMPFISDVDRDPHQRYKACTRHTQGSNKAVVPSQQGR